VTYFFDANQHFMAPAEEPLGHDSFISYTSFPYEVKRERRGEKIGRKYGTEMENVLTVVFVCDSSPLSPASAAVHLLCL
jgi:hypothetical protein